MLHGADQPHAMRMARVFDDRDERGDPLVFRPVLPRLEWQEVRLYLAAGHPVMEAYDEKQLVDLHTDGELDRFGPGEGNTVFVAGGRLVER